jgi:hypothetical protein
MTRAEILWVIAILLVTALFLVTFSFVRSTTPMHGVLRLSAILVAATLFYITRPPTQKKEEA